MSEPLAPQPVRPGRTNDNSPPIYRWDQPKTKSQSVQRTVEKEALMSHSYVSNLMHCIFSTKNRYPFIDSELESRLWPYLGGIAKQNRMKALAIGGTTDHLHALLSLPGMMSFAKAVQLIKGGSSKWINDTFSGTKKFEWQEGYGAFSVSVSQVPKTIAYINNQKEHHRKKTFQEEFLELLTKHGIEYDQRYVF
jgi:putative transposase